MFPEKPTQLKQSEIIQLIAIQRGELAESFINNFSDSFLQIFFNNVIKNPDNFLLIVRNGDKIIAFSIVCKNNSRFMMDFVKKDFLKIFFAVFKTLINNPLLFPKIITTLLMSKKANKNSVELLYLAVYKKYQGRGIGKKLIKKVNEILRKEGVSRYLLGTRVDNKNTNSFYRHLGYKHFLSTDSFGVAFNYYYFDL